MQSWEASETAATAALPYESAPESFNAAPAAEAHDNESQPRDLHNEVQHDCSPANAQLATISREPRRFGRQPREHRGFDRKCGRRAAARVEPSSSSVLGSGLEPLPGESISNGSARESASGSGATRHPASASHVDEVEGHLQEGQTMNARRFARSDEIASTLPRNPRTTRTCIRPDTRKNNMTYEAAL